MRVFVKNQRSEPLMPTTPRKAKMLLKESKAKVVKRTPFTIQLIGATGETTQSITLGVDSGFIHVGLSAVSEKAELFSAEVMLRNDIVKLNSERMMYRRARRGCKTRYRKPRFLNRIKSEGWLAPSIQHKLDSHKKLIKMLKGLLPITRVVIEVAAFDIQKIKNPEIFGKGYQNGEQRGFWNVREYVLYRDGHKCQAPKCNHKDPILNVHHLESRQIGGDRPENLTTLCETCHKKYHQGKIILKVRQSKSFRSETFMAMVRRQLIDETSVRPTFGYITKAERLKLGLEKSHRNDAFVIAGGHSQVRSQSFVVKQVRKCNRKLYKGVRSQIKNTAPLLVLGFKRFDKVKFRGKECIIFGRRIRGTFDLRSVQGTRVHSDARVKELIRLEAAKTFLIGVSHVVI